MLTVYFAFAGWMKPAVMWQLSYSRHKQLPCSDSIGQHQPARRASGTGCTSKRPQPQRWRTSRSASQADRGRRGQTMMSCRWPNMFSTICELSLKSLKKKLTDGFSWHVWVKCQSQTMCHPISRWPWSGHSSAAASAVVGRWTPNSVSSLWKGSQNMFSDNMLQTLEVKTRSESRCQLWWYSHRQGRLTASVFEEVLAHVYSKRASSSLRKKNVCKGELSKGDNMSKALNWGRENEGRVCEAVVTDLSQLHHKELTCTLATFIKKV